MICDYLEVCILRKRKSNHNVWPYLDCLCACFLAQRKLCEGQKIMGILVKLPLISVLKIILAWPSTLTSAVRDKIMVEKWKGSHF